jgi:hypothetical protein
MVLSTFVIVHKFFVVKIERTPFILAHNAISWDHDFGECTLQCTQFERNLELHIISKVVTHKISLTLNYFKDHI